MLLACSRSTLGVLRELVLLGTGGFLQRFLEDRRFQVAAVRILRNARSQSVTLVSGAAPLRLLTFFISM